MQKETVFSSYNAVKIQIGMILATSYCIEIPRYFESDIVQVFCNDHWYTVRVDTDLVENELYQLIYRTIVVSLVKRYVPLTLTAAMTGSLLSFIRRKRKVRRSLVETDARRLRGAVARGAVTTDDVSTKVLAMVAVAYILCLLPGAVYPILRVTMGYTSFFYHFTAIADTIAAVNSSLNFFIYYLHIMKFRNILKKLIKETLPRNDKNSVSPATDSSHVNNINVINVISINVQKRRGSENPAEVGDDVNDRRK